MNTLNSKGEVEEELSEKSASCIDQVLNNKGLEWHGGVVGSVCACSLDKRAELLPCIYKITNTRRLGLSSQLGPDSNFMNGMMHHYLSCIVVSRNQSG